MGGSKRIFAAALLVVLAGCDNSPLPKGAAEQNTIYSAMVENTPRHLDPTASYWSNDTLVTYQVYEPPYGYHYLKRPFELVPKSAEKVVTPIYLDKARQPVARRRPRRAGGRERLRSADQEGHPVPAASRIRTGRARPLSLPRPEARRDRQAPRPDRVRAQRHARAGRRGLRLCPEAPRHDAHHDADLRCVLRVRHRAEGLRRADQARGRQAARRSRSGQPRQAVSRFPSLAAGRRHGAREAPAAHPDPGQVPAVEVLDADDLHGSGALGGRCVLCPARHGRARHDAGPVAGGHRALHGDRVRKGPPHRDDPQPQLPRRAVSVRRHAR